MTEKEKAAASCEQFHDFSKDPFVKCLNNGQIPLIFNKIENSKTPEYLEKASSVSSHYCFA